VSMTVTATGASGAGDGTYLYIRCVQNGSEAGGNSASVGDGASHASLTPADTNSLPFWALVAYGVEATLTAESGNSVLENFQDTANGNTFAAGDYTGTVTGGTPVTVGSSSESSNCSLAAYEITPAGGSGGTAPSVDSAASPAFASSTTNAVTSPAFTPGSGEVIVVMAGSSCFEASPAMTITNTGGLTFTLRKSGLYTDFGGAWIYTATAPAAPALADEGAAADQIATQITSIPPAVTAAPPRPSGPAPAPIPPQVLLVPAGRAVPQDAAAAADTFAVTAETVPLADVAGAADYSSSQIFQDDAAGAAEAVAIDAYVTFPQVTTGDDAPGPFTSQPGGARPGLAWPAFPGGVTSGTASDAAAAADAITPDAAVTLADAAGAADAETTSGSSTFDAAGAAETFTAGPSGVHLADTAAAADAVGQSPATGASGGASRPQAYPGTSQVAVAAPGSSTWYYLGSLGTITALTYSFKFPGGCDQMTCTVMVPASYRTQLFNPGWQVKVIRGGHTVWAGVLDEPVPVAGAGWNLTAAGTGNLGTNFVAYYTDAWPSGEPDEAVNDAIGRGLPWVNPGVGQPAGAWFGQAVDPAAQNITDLLNLVCTRGGLMWYVNSQPGGYIGNDLSVFPLPSVPNRLLVCTTPVPRTLGGAVRSIFVRYEITADTTDSSGNSVPATYGLVEVSNSAAAAYGAAASEQYLDLSDVGVLTAAQAEAVASYILEIYQQISFGSSFSAQYGQLLNIGGVPVDPGTDQAGTVIKLILTDFAYGGDVIPQPVIFVVGSYMWDDFGQVATIQAYNTLNMSISSLLSLETQLLTPIQAASG
jgi:hypothetical protein